MKRVVTLTALTALLAGCASGGPRPLPREQFQRTVAAAPGAAQPGKIVAVELEFARAAQDSGQWTAFRTFAAPGALIHGRSGPIVAETWLAGLKDPDEAVRWNPQTVWMSCNGRLAVSQGRFRDPESKVGDFVTVWQRQQDDQYRWTYDVAVLDDPQPPKPVQDEPVDDDAIVVSAISSIKGLVADCSKRGQTTPQPPALAIATDISHKATTSSDGTLRWRWEHQAGAQRRFVAEYLTSGKWVVALDQPLGNASPAASSE